MRVPFLRNISIKKLATFAAFLLLLTNLIVVSYVLTFRTVLYRPSYWSEFGVSACSEDGSGNKFELGYELIPSVNRQLERINFVLKDTQSSLHHILSAITNISALNSIKKELSERNA